MRSSLQPHPLLSLSKSYCIIFISKNILPPAPHFLMKTPSFSTGQLLLCKVSLSIPRAGGSFSFQSLPTGLFLVLLTVTAFPVILVLNISCIYVSLCEENCHKLGWLIYYSREVEQILNALFVTEKPRQASFLDRVIVWEDGKKGQW